MLAKQLSSIRNYMLSVSSQIKYNFYHQNNLLDAFRTNSCNIIGRNRSMVISLIATQDYIYEVKHGSILSLSNSYAKAMLLDFDVNNIRKYPSVP